MLSAPDHLYDPSKMRSSAGQMSTESREIIILKKCTIKTIMPRFLASANALATVQQECSTQAHIERYRGAGVYWEWACCEGAGGTDGSVMLCGR
jgi:hypothetical protein